MSYISYSGALTVNGNTWLVNARKSGIFTHMAKSMISQIDAMLAHHNKIHILRFDLHQPDYTDDNQRITDFNRRLHGMLKSRYKLTRIGFIWVRELERAKSQHYHYALVLDGNKVQYPQNILDLATKVWSFIDGFLWTPTNCFYQLRDDRKKHHTGKLLGQGARQGL
ncbi:MAG: hypothetical protein RL497_2070 [Pseudomonadota bacterium]|jgi:hypothetical protein